LRFSDFYEDRTIHVRPNAPMSPAVSVVLATCNRADGGLQRAVDSVLGQTAADFELIVVDDGSNDGTADLLADYQKNDPRVVIHRFGKSSGLQALRIDQGALSAKGRHIAYQFEDCGWTPDSLAVRLDAVNSIAEPTVVYALAEAHVAQPDGSLAPLIVGGPFNYALLRNGNFLAANTVLHPKVMFDRCGLFDPHVLARRWFEYDLWLRFGRRYPFHFVDRVVSTLRVDKPGDLDWTGPQELTRCRKYVEIERVLSSPEIGKYDVLDTALMQSHFSDFERDKARREIIIPFLARNNDYFSPAIRALQSATRRRNRRVLVSKPDYSTSIDVTLRNFTSLPGFPVQHAFVPEQSSEEVELNDFDSVILYRTVARVSTRLLTRHYGEKTFIYLMDDNMLRFHDVGPGHVVLAPGTPAFEEISRQIQLAHACIGYSEQIVADMALLNPRTMRLDTNIPLRFIEKRKYRRSGALRVAVFSGDGRRGILQRLWPALEQFCAQMGDAAEFHFWGIDPHDFAPLTSPVHRQAFSHSYELYRDRLLADSFDVMLAPLETETLAGASKSPIKLLESVVCGAVCIVTETPPYAGLPDSVCIKTGNSVDEWLAALTHARDIGLQGRHTILEEARAFVTARYATELQSHDFLATLDAADLHRKMGGRRIVYVFHEAPLNGGSLHLLHHAGMAASLGFSVIGLVRRRADTEAHFGSLMSRWQAATGNNELMVEDWTHRYDGTHLNLHQRRPTASDMAEAEWLAERVASLDIGLIHATTWMPAIAELGRILRVPRVFSVHHFYKTEPGALHGFADAIHCSSLINTRRWEHHSGAPARRMVCPVGDKFFHAYPSNRDRIARGEPIRRAMILGTLQPRKNQCEAIGAIGALVRSGHDISLDLIGHDNAVPEYGRQCREEIARLGLAERVRLHGFTDTPEFAFDSQAGILLIAATIESMPQTILQAMAAGILVVTTDVGGITELIKHNYTGIVARGLTSEDIADALRQALGLTPQQRLDMIDRAHRAISLLGNPAYIRAELIDLYKQAFEVHTEREWDTSDQIRYPAPAPRMDGHSAHRRLQLRAPAPPSAPASRISAVPDDEQLIACAQPSFEIVAEGEQLTGAVAVLRINGGGLKRIRVRLAAAIRPDVILRIDEVDVPADDLPKCVTFRFAPVSPPRGQKLRIDIESDHGSVSAYAFKSRAHVPLTLLD